jgi:hypothetical protein
VDGRLGQIDPAALRGAVELGGGGQRLVGPGRLVPAVAVHDAVGRTGGRERRQRVEQLDLATHLRQFQAV